MQIKPVHWQKIQGHVKNRGAVDYGKYFITLYESKVYSEEIDKNKINLKLRHQVLSIVISE